MFSPERAKRRAVTRTTWLGEIVSLNLQIWEGTATAGTGFGGRDCQLKIVSQVHGKTPVENGDHGILDEISRKTTTNKI